jgi:hypothetical protein
VLVDGRGWSGIGEAILDAMAAASLRNGPNFGLHDSVIIMGSAPIKVRICYLKQLRRSIFGTIKMGTDKYMLPNGGRSRCDPSQILLTRRAGVPTRDTDVGR